MSFGAKLKEELALRKMTQKSFAEQLDIPALQLRHIVNEKEQPSIELAQKVGDLMGPDQESWLRLLENQDVVQAELRAEREIKAAEEAKKKAEQTAQRAERKKQAEEKKRQEEKARKDDKNRDSRFPEYIMRDVGKELCSVKNFRNNGMVVIHNSQGKLNSMSVSVFNSNGGLILYKQKFLSHTVEGIQKELDKLELLVEVPPVAPVGPHVPYSRRANPHSRPIAIPSETLSMLEAYDRQNNQHFA